MTIPFLDQLADWHRDYLESGGRRGVQVRFSGPNDTPKRSVMIVAEARSATGEMILWESGECDTLAVGVSSQGENVPLLLRSRVLPLASAVASVADDLVDHVADYSGD